MEIAEVIAKIKREMNNIYSDMSAEMPSKSDPQSTEKVKHIASAASANASRMAVYLKELVAYEKQREAEIAIAAIESKSLCTPKDEHLRALYKKELSNVYAYEKLCQDMLDICRQRVTLAQTFLKTSGVEDSASWGSRL